MKLLSSCLFLFFMSNIFAQTDSSKKISNPADTFKTVQVEAQFPGGMDGWTKYLQSNLNADLGARYVKVKKGETVIKTALISFIVDPQGNVTEVTCMNPDELPAKLAKEAIRVIKEGPKWIPAWQNGKHVYYRQKQRISWQVVGD
jgi:protein TonB